jgi:hypothetical protein
LVTPEPLPLKLGAIIGPVAVKPPVTLTLVPDCFINEFPIVVLLVHTGMVLVVPLPCTACARAAAAQPTIIATIEIATAGVASRWFLRCFFIPFEFVLIASIAVLLFMSPAAELILHRLSRTVS